MRVIKYIAVAAAGLGLIAFRLNTVGLIQDQDIFKNVEKETTQISKVPALKSPASKASAPEAVYVLTGDIYVDNVYPFIDSRSDSNILGSAILIPEHGILEYGILEHGILEHGALSHSASLEASRTRLEDVRLKAERAIAQGLTLEQFLASDPLASGSLTAESLAPESLASPSVSESTAYDDKMFGSKFLSSEQFLTIVYNDLAATP